MAERAFSTGLHQVFGKKRKEMHLAKQIPAAAKHAFLCMNHSNKMHALVTRHVFKLEKKKHLETNEKFIVLQGKFDYGTIFQRTVGNSKL